jgi:N-acetylglucosaminyl-diphospho-decaprenol L-rhamnosyltransferase
MQGLSTHTVPDVSLIIISLNSRHFLIDCIRSIRESIWRNVTYELIVVDNGSTDGTVALLERDYPEVKLIANKTNAGYCKAGNMGAEIADGRYFVFLNDDILIVEDAFPKLVEFMDAHPEAGMIGSRLLNLDGTDQFSSGRSFTSPMNALFSRKSPLTKWFPNSPWAKTYLLSDRINGTEPYEVDWLSAAAMMVRREAFEHGGRLVEDFYYFHEQIICKRIQEAGYKNYLHPESKIIHYEGMGSGKRTRRIRRLHIQRFHIAAYKWYCLHCRLSAWHPFRGLIAGALAMRAAVLIAVDNLKPPSRDALSQTNRPEGGIPL